LKKVIFIGLVFFLPWLAFANRGADKGFSIETNLKAFLSTDHYSAYSIKSLNHFCASWIRKMPLLKASVLLFVMFSKRLISDF
jgi:enoyl-[acyl-carrier-protein] reductase (NADH)